MNDPEKIAFDETAAEDVSTDAPANAAAHAGASTAASAASALLERARRFNPQALAEIHDRYYPEVYRYVSYRLNDVQLSEQVSAQVFGMLLKALRKRRTPIASLPGWLFETAGELVNQHLNAAIPSAPGSSPALQALLGLEIEQQHLLALRFSGPHSLEETAQMSGKTLTALKELQIRALHELYRRLSGAGEQS